MYKKCIYNNNQAKYLYKFLKKLLVFFFFFTFRNYSIIKSTD